MSSNNKPFSNIFTRLLANVFYPIGRGFIDFTDTDYSNYLGLQWERELVGMTAVGLDTSQEEFNTIGKIGGSKAHKHVSGIGADNGGIYIKSDDDIIVNEKRHYKNISDFSNEQAGARYAYTNNSSSLQPYKVVAYWKRVG